MTKKYRVTLAAEERDELERLLARGKADVRKIKHAQILLKADEAEGGPAWPDTHIAEALDAGITTPASRRWNASAELSALARQCLSRRMARQDTLVRQIAQWQADRNAAKAKVKWQVTTADARVKLRSLYPSLQP